MKNHHFAAYFPPPTNHSCFPLQVCNRGSSPLVGRAFDWPCQPARSSSQASKPLSESPDHKELDTELWNRTEYCLLIVYGKGAALQPPLTSLLSLLVASACRHTVPRDLLSPSPKVIYVLFLGGCCLHAPGLPPFFPSLGLLACYHHSPRPPVTNGLISHTPSTPLQLPRGRISPD